jgi:FAD/FMN-containing dehydrogenase
MRHHGLTVDSLLACDVVLADGTAIRCSADEHPELFWALRGGGGNFGVVTAFTFRAHRVGPLVLGGMLVYPWEQARDVFRASRELMAGAPEALTIFDVLITAPPQAPFPPELQGRRVAAVAVCWSGPLDEGERVLAPLPRRAPARAGPRGPDAVRGPAVDDRRDRAARRRLLRPHALPQRGGRRLHRRAAGRLRAGPDAAGARHDGVDGRGGRPRRAGRDRLRPPAGAGADVDHRGLRRRAGRPRDRVGPAGLADTAPFASGGVYVNALDAGGSVREAYADGIWERLVAVKRRYDPDGVFAANGIG